MYTVNFPNSGSTAAILMCVLLLGGCAEPGGSRFESSAGSHELPRSVMDNTAGFESVDPGLNPGGYPEGV